MVRSEPQGEKRANIRGIIYYEDRKLFHAALVVSGAPGVVGNAP